MRPKYLLLMLGALAVAAAVAVSAAGAGNPEIIRLEFSGTFMDPNFCGTGKTVNIASSMHGTLFTDPNQAGVDERLTLDARDVFTNRLNGEAVVGHSAGETQLTFPPEPGRVIDTDIGLRAQLVHHGPGGLLVRDAGYVVFDFTFTIAGGEIVVEHGSHPSLEAILEGNDLFCRAATSALGLS